MRKNEKFERDFALAKPLLEKAEAGVELTDMERAILVSIISVPYHTSGKIEGLLSIDSSASGCEFCKWMREIAEQLKAHGNDKHICGECYASRGRFLLNNVKNRHELNMAILSIVEFKSGDFVRMGLMELVRINSDGDIRNVTHARNIIRIMNDNAFARFGWWGKNVKDITSAMDELGKPKNCILIASSFLIGKVIKLPRYFDYTFTAYETEEDVQEAIRNGSVECNGRKCKDCGFMCYKGAWKIGANIAEKKR